MAAEIHVPPLEPGSPISSFWADTWQRSREAMLSTGLVDDAAVDAAVRYLESDACAALYGRHAHGLGAEARGTHGLTGTGHRPELMRRVATERKG